MWLATGPEWRTCILRAADRVGQSERIHREARLSALSPVPSCVRYNGLRAIPWMEADLTRMPRAIGVASRRETADAPR